MPFKKCLFQFPVSAVHEFFHGTFLNFFRKPFSMSEFAGFNYIYMSISVKALAECPAKDANFIFEVLP